ncbi:hypothetical protein RMSM_01934 [Rhodopirellula maiorica SM1]|uniref:Uncharacterized protein n=1 Tax=Rhodopirellula maiorica SM1 TaxID=1265738 RepID=M5S0G8_9BACT|nr:hypothetical protein RMSM_01934 [Rhodopirellula maiorica SM1]
MATLESKSNTVILTPPRKLDRVDRDASARNYSVRVNVVDGKNEFSEKNRAFLGCQKKN